VQTLLRRVRVRPADDLSARFPREMPCRLQIHLKDGTTYSIEKRDYEGHYCTRCERFWSDTEVASHDGNCPDFPELHGKVPRRREPNKGVVRPSSKDRTPELPSPLLSITEAPSCWVCSAIDDFWRHM